MYNGHVGYRPANTTGSLFGTVLEFVRAESAAGITYLAKVALYEPADADEASAGIFPTVDTATVIRGLSFILCSDIGPLVAFLPPFKFMRNSKGQISRGAPIDQKSIDSTVKLVAGNSVIDRYLH